MFSRLVAREVGWQKLDGDVAIQPGVGGLVHHAHPAGAKLRDDAVGPECCTGSQGHSERAILPLGGCHVERQYR